MLLVWFVIFLCLNNFTSANVSCGVPKIRHTAAIVGGSTTKHGEWPWHTAIYQRKGTTDSYVCGGTLISKNFVLTAAHCLYNEYTFQLLIPKRIFVRLGIHNLNEINSITMREFPIHEYYLFNNYSRENLENDIALLELGEVVPFSDYILPACLNTNPDATNLTGTAIGWGRTDIDDVSPVLKKADLPIIEAVSCLLSDRDYFGKTIGHNMFCAGHQNGTTICNGDSGGGLFIKRDNKWILTGISSFIKKRSDESNFCSTENYGGFTNVARYIPWIQNITNLKILDNVSSFCGRRNQVRKFKIGSQHNVESSLEYNWPWHGVLYVRPETGIPIQKCGVTVLSKRAVVTIHYCMRENIVHKYFVKLGLTEDIHGRPRANQEHDIENIIIVNDRVKYWRHKIAVLQLLTEITFTEHVQPICLWKGDSSLDSIGSQTGYVISWEFDKKHELPLSPIETTLETVTYSKCTGDDEIIIQDVLGKTGFCAVVKSGDLTRVSVGSGFFVQENDQWMLRGIYALGILEVDFRIFIEIPSLTLNDLL